MEELLLEHCTTVRSSSLRSNQDHRTDEGDPVTRHAGKKIILMEGRNDGKIRPGKETFSGFRKNMPMKKIKGSLSA